MLKLSGVKGLKNDNSEFVAPSNVQPNDVILGFDASHFNIEGLDAGDTVVAGQYFYGLYNEVEKKFVSALKPLPQFTVLGEANVGNATVTPTNNGANISVGDNA